MTCRVNIKCGPIKNPNVSLANLQATNTIENLKQKQMHTGNNIKKHI